MKTKRAAKPKALSINHKWRDFPSAETSASCQQWECDMEGDGRYEIGRTVNVPAMCFDESGGKQLRRLAKWLGQAAAWVEARK